MVDKTIETPPGGTLAAGKRVDDAAALIQAIVEPPCSRVRKQRRAKRCSEIALARPAAPQQRAGQREGVGAEDAERSGEERGRAERPCCAAERYPRDADDRAICGGA